MIKSLVFKVKIGPTNKNFAFKRAKFIKIWLYNVKIDQNLGFEVNILVIKVKIDQNFGFYGHDWPYQSKFWFCEVKIDQNLGF